MTILQSLAAYYDRLLARGEASESGYAPQKISFELVVAKNGMPVSLNDLRDLTGKKPAPRLIEAPVVSRTSGIEPAFLWDKTAYSLGVADTRTEQEKKGKAPVKPGSAKRTADEHAAFRKFHEEALAGTGDVGLRAFLAFLQRWTPGQFTTLGFPLDAIDQNIVFRLDGEFEHLHTRAAARAIWTSLSTPTADETKVQCLISGELASAARLHPTIKGVKGAQSSGAALASFNLDAFRSYDKDQGENAPVSAGAAFAYGTALNRLLSKDSGRSVLVGDATCVFWADVKETSEKTAEAAESFFSSALDPNDKDPDQLDAGRMRAAMEAIAKGRAAEVKPDLDPRTRMHILGLSPNAGRIAVRFWHVGTLGELAANLAQHWRDLEIEPSPFKRAPAAWALLYETAMQRKAENIPPRLGGDLMRTVLGGGRYAQTLLASVIGRIRADGDMNGVRAAICKAIINRDARIAGREEDIPVALERDNTNPAYRLGRLFALLERAQTLALPGLNATIRDRFFASASATPQRIFPTLIKNHQHHVASLRKGDKPGLGVWIDKEIGDVWAGLEPDLPTALRLEDQGRFFAGYYHQRFARKDKTGTENPAADAAETAPHTEE